MFGKSSESVRQAAYSDANSLSRPVAQSGVAPFTQLRLWLPVTKGIVALHVYLKVNHKLQARAKHGR